MVTAMRAQIDNLKVLDAVVMAVTVLVVHMFGGEQRSSDVLLHHHAMLTAAVPIDLHLAIRRASSAAGLRERHGVRSQLHLGLARPRAKARGRQPVGWHPDSLTTVLAGDLAAIEASASFRLGSAAHRAELLVNAG